MSPQITDHNGNDVTHGRETVNGVRLHYVTAGSGEPLVLLHGVPKSSWYWSRIIPLLTPHYTVIAPDLRGFGDSFRPKDGYDMGTIAEDVAQLTSALGFDRFFLHGEDWGATFENIELDKKWAERKLTMPVLAVGSRYFIGEENRRQMERVAEDVRYVELDCGHSMALERPERLARELRDFFGE